MATNLRRFSRNAWVKAVSFFLFVACAVTIVLVSYYLNEETKGDNYREGINLYDHLAGHSFENSQYLSRIINTEFNSLLNDTGFSNDTIEEARERAEENKNDFGREGRILYFISMPHLRTSNNVLSEEEFKKSASYRGITELPDYAQTQWNSLADGWEYDATNQRIENTRDQFYQKNKGIIRFSFTETYTAYLRALYTKQGNFLWNFAGLYITLGALALLCLIHLLLVCGRTGDEAVRHPYRKNVALSPIFDRPWLDMSLTIVIFFDILCSWAIVTIGSDMSENNFNRSQVFNGVLIGLFAAASLWWLLCAVKRIKDRSILRYTLIYVVLSGIFRFLWKHGLKPAAGAARDFLAGLPLVWKSAVWTGMGLFIMLILFLYGYEGAPLVFAYLLLLCAAVYLLYKASCLARIAKGLQRLAKGDYDTPTDERGALRRMAHDLNAATDGLKIAVEKELTSQRLKSELITNVSHDLRTPLTSVITYADLLQNEGLGSPDAERYLEIIRQKAQRLQALTEDLFEASKASSGETRAAPEALDLSQLIEQSLGEMGDRLRAVPLEVRVSGGCGAVLADGRLLCRVFENLLRNIEKYALPRTRVYIDTTATDTSAIVTLRNISSQPLEGNAERLFERFARGDEARSSEGSGLGLAIVKSFMELQNGSCELSADGDLFKVILTLPLADGKTLEKQDEPAPQAEGGGATRHPYRELAAAFGNLFRNDGKDE